MLRLIEDEDAYENYQNTADDFNIAIEEVVIIIDSIILKRKTRPVIHPFIPLIIPSPITHRNHSIKLPQIDIKKFSGDVQNGKLFLIHLGLLYIQTTNSPTSKK